MVRVTIIGLWLSLMLGALGELWLEIQSLFPHSLYLTLPFYITVLILGLNLASVCRMCSHMLVEVLMFERFSAHSSIFSSMNGYNSD